MKAVKRLQDALYLAFKLEDEFGDTLPEPTVTVDERTGHIDFEWYLDSRTSVVVWCDEGHVSWAGLDGDTSSHGRNESDQFVLPYPLRSMLFSVVAKIRERDDCQHSLHSRVSNED